MKQSELDKRKNIALGALHDAIKVKFNVDLSRCKANVDVDVKTERLATSVLFWISLTGDCAFEGTVEVRDDGEIEVNLSDVHNLPQLKADDDDFCDNPSPNAYPFL